MEEVRLTGVIFALVGFLLTPTVLILQVQTLRSQQENKRGGQSAQKQPSGGIGGLLDTFDEEQIMLRKNSCALNTGKTSQGHARLRRNSKTGRLTVSRKTAKGRDTVTGNSPTRLTSIKEAGASPKQRLEVSAECRKHQMPGRESMKAAKVDFPKSQKIAALIEEAVNHNILFQAMSHVARTQCIAAFQGPRQVDGGDTVIRQNERKGEEFFVVESGCCEIVVEADGKGEEPIGNIHRGQSFGELSLMYHQPRAATVRATEVTRLWVLERKHYQVSTW